MTARGRRRARTDALEQRARIERMRLAEAERLYWPLYALVRSREFQQRWQAVTRESWDSSIEHDPHRVMARVEAMIEVGEVSVALRER